MSYDWYIPSGTLAYAISGFYPISGYLYAISGIPISRTSRYRGMYPILGYWNPDIDPDIGYIPISGPKTPISGTTSPISGTISGIISAYPISGYANSDIGYNIGCNIGIPDIGPWYLQYRDEYRV